MFVRAFIAINISDKIKERVKPALKELREIGASTVPPKNLHLTLKFLGNIKPDKLEQVKQALSKIEFSPFKIKFKGVGAFPNKDYIRVVWVGAESKELEDLSQEINRELKGLFPEDKSSAHLTLARVKKKLELSKFFEKYKDERFGSFEVHSFELMQSELSREGPVYSILWSSGDSF